MCVKLSVSNGRYHFSGTTILRKERKEWNPMMYPFLTLDDQTEIVHSKVQSNDSVKVYIEKPEAKDGFHSAYCHLLDYKWYNVSGSSQEELRATRVSSNPRHTWSCNSPRMEDCLSQLFMKIKSKERMPMFAGKTTQLNPTVTRYLYNATR